ncbi:MAG: hypothetical protein Q9210_004670 [Variospora velana]
MPISMVRTKLQNWNVSRLFITKKYRADSPTAHPTSCSSTPQITPNTPPATTKPVTPHIQSNLANNSPNGALYSYLAFHAARNTSPCFASTATTSSAITNVPGTNASPFSTLDNRNGALTRPIRSAAITTSCPHTCTINTGSDMSTILRLGNDGTDNPTVISAEIPRNPSRKFQP